MATRRLLFVLCALISLLILVALLYAAYKIGTQHPGDSGGGGIPVNPCAPYEPGDPLCGYPGK